MPRRILKNRLYRKILIWAFLPTLVIMSVVAIVLFQSYQQVTEELVVQRNRELARLLASKVSTEAGELIRIFDGFASEYSQFLYAPAWQREWAVSAAQQFTIFDGGIYHQSSGRDLIEILTREVILPKYLDQSPAIQHIRLRMNRQFETVITDSTSLTIGGDPIIAFSVPIHGTSGLLVGVAPISPSPASGLYRWFESMNLSTRGTVYIVDGNGIVLFHTQAGEVGKDYNQNDYVRAVVAGKVGSLRARSEAGEDVVVSYAPIIGTRWGLVTQESWATLVASNRGYMISLLFLMALGVIVPTAVVSLTVSRILQPIQDLTEASKQMAGGNFDRLVEAHTGDEVEELAEQFNRMASQLQASYATLEQRVQDRTRELTTVNAIARVVSSTLDLDKILTYALNMTCDATGMESGAVVLLEGGARTPRLFAQRSLSPRFAASLDRLLAADPTAASANGTIGDPATAIIAGNGKPLVIETGSVPSGELRAALEADGVRQIVNLPLRAKGAVTGAISLFTVSPRVFPHEDLEMLTSIGNQVGVAVENAKLYRQAEETAAAAERNRLARELHDAVTQTLFSVSIMTEVLPRIWEKDPEEGKARLEEISQLTKGALGEMRSLLIELRPQALVEADIRDLFRHLANAFSGRELVPVHLDLAPDCELPAEVKITLYRIAQEAFNNIAKHAGATRVEVCLKDCEAHVCLSIRDNGVGFDPANISPDHFGLKIMEERASNIGARLEIHSDIGKGTEVNVTWKKNNLSG